MRSHLSYMMWLVAKIAPPDEPAYVRQFTTLMDRLYHIPYELVPGTIFSEDEARLKDGLALRDEFCRDNFAQFWDDPCSILELMIAMSIRIDEFMINPHNGSRLYFWFWTMLDNWLGDAAKYSDGIWGRDHDDMLLAMIKKLELHDYEPSGKGGFFYAPYSQHDMRALNLWYQMQEFIKTIKE